MLANPKKFTLNEFPLRLMPSVRRLAEAFSQREGISLNQFINVAVAEKLAYLQHEEWLARRPKATSGSIAKAHKILWAIQQAALWKKQTNSRKAMCQSAASTLVREPRQERNNRSQLPCMPNVKVSARRRSRRLDLARLRSSSVGLDRFWDYSHKLAVNLYSRATGSTILSLPCPGFAR
jgi:hypothetical protein